MRRSLCFVGSGCGEQSEITAVPTPVRVIVCCEGGAASMTLSGTLVPRVENQLAFRSCPRTWYSLDDHGSSQRA